MLEVSALVKERWRTGEFGNVQVFRAFNEMVLVLFNVGERLKLGREEVDSMGTGIDERAKELRPKLLPMKH